MTKPNIEVMRVTKESDLEELVDQINAASWDAANEMVVYETSALASYLERQDTLFVVCRDTNTNTLLGFASGRFEMKPYDHELWLYVDEVDVCADQRQKGAGKAIMNKLLDIAEDEECEEVWLGTEVDNVAANALYRSIDPDDIEQFVGYTWETD